MKKKQTNLNWNKTWHVYLLKGNVVLSHRYGENDYLRPSCLNPQMGDRTGKSRMNEWRCHISQGLIINELITDINKSEWIWEQFKEKNILRGAEKVHHIGDHWKSGHFNTEHGSLVAEEATADTQVWKLKELKQVKLDWRVYKSVYSPTGRELNSVSRISKDCKSRWELGWASVGLAGLVISCSFSFCICA